ncbi:hypothetical protein I6A84_00635 [Frankia sp. CNm7]|uniref:Uncharacterized protein n=1 Tax=Frankia nepalensis TaxID=1836974 RepID=A0A937REB0_9ACTN|nr:HAD hydrolase-like protein [Frankia nepalensis]MBL7496661.1 hypothetical protein [Frankia nepalensis]MBL7510697.1 hypothetical protein [Frankia nepalensis]MBL7516670.1 hypothetical protein [Frankia nepalensis]MBL7627400.1 hypothetical protein [Frankia nepalensis]
MTATANPEPVTWSDGLRAVIFDLDGTLLDHESSAVAALRQWAPRLDVETVTDTPLAA